MARWDRYLWIQKYFCSPIWDVNINFIRKAQLVSNGKLIDAPPSITYAFLVSRDSVCLDLILAALNGCNFFAPMYRTLILMRSLRRRYTLRPVRSLAQGGARPLLLSAPYMVWMVMMVHVYPPWDTWDKTLVSIYVGLTWNVKTIINL